MTDTPSPRAPLSRTTREPFRGSEAVRDGRITPGRLRGADFVGLHPDVFVGADAVTAGTGGEGTVDVALGVRRCALAVWGGPVAVVGGSLAADALGVPIVDERAEIVLPVSHRRPVGAVVVRRDRLPPEEVVEVGGVRVTSPVRTAFDLARRLPLADGVAMADALGRRHRFGPAALRSLAWRHPGVRGIRSVWRVAALMDTRAESLPESRVRVALALRGVPTPDLQVRVQTPIGPFRLDLAWERWKVALEYDGEEHRHIERHGRDLDRDAALEELGWIVLRITARQLERPDALAARVLAAIVRRSRRGGHDGAEVGA